MSIHDLVGNIGDYSLALVGLFAALPLLAFIIGSLHDKGQGGSPPYRWLYAALIYAACIPGTFSTILTLYSLLFLSANLLKADVVVYFLPIASMILTLGIMSRRVSFDDIPGFDRLSGLVMLLALTFFTLFFLARTRVWLIFGGGISSLLAISAAAFALFRWASHAFFRRRDEPEVEFPDL